MSKSLLDKELTELTDLQSVEVSLVKAGANKKKRFPVFKEEKLTMNDFEEVLKVALEAELDEEIDLEEWLSKAELSDKGKAAMKSVLRIVSGYKEELPNDIQNAFEKIASLLGYPKPKEKAKAKDEEKMPNDKYPEPTKKELEPITTTNADLELVKKVYQEEIEVIKKQHAAVEAQLKAERDERELASWVQKAKDELAYVPGKSAQELGVELKKLHDIDPKMAKSHFEVLKSTSKTMEDSEIFREAGRIGTSSDNGSAWDEIVKLANGVIEKSEDIDLTQAQAIDRVLSTERGAKLYDKYLQEHPRQTGRA